jgi:hypothetical protein
MPIVFVVKSNCIDFEETMPTLGLSDFQAA